MILYPFGAYLEIRFTHRVTGVQIPPSPPTNSGLLIESLQVRSLLIFRPTKFELIINRSRWGSAGKSGQDDQVRKAEPNRKPVTMERTSRLKPCSKQCAANIRKAIFPRGGRQPSRHGGYFKNASKVECLSQNQDCFL